MFVNIQADSFTLTVNNGSGEGYYEESSRVNIWANPYDDSDPDRRTYETSDPKVPHRIFDRWTGDTVYLADIFAAQTSLIMPAIDINVTAQYKSVSQWSVPKAISYFPITHKGVIFLFHAHGGSAINLFSKTENYLFVNDAISRNYAVVAIDSFDQVNKQWDLTVSAADNIDMQRVAALRDNLISLGKINLTDKIYVLGISNGGIFASLFDQTNQGIINFPVDASAIYISPGNSDIMKSTEVPTIFLLAENDSFNFNEIALNTFNNLLNRNVPAQYWVNHPSPVYAQRFWRIQGISRTDSEVIYNALRSGGLLDDKDFLIDNPISSGWRSLIPAEYSKYALSIDTQLLISHAEHSFTSNFNHKTLNFFDNPTTINDFAPVISGFSPNNGEWGTLVTIEGSGFINVTEVTFSGIVTPIVNSSINKLLVKVPYGASTGSIEVTNTEGTAMSPFCFVVSSPEITSLDPEEGGVGTLVSITGNSFVGVNVNFNGVSAEIVSKTINNIWVQVPVGATTGAITVTNDLGTSTSANNFTVIHQPIINNFTPTSGPAGTIVTITGENFSRATSVKLGDVSQLFSVDSDTQISATISNEATTRKIRVTTPGGTVFTDSFFKVR
ncbi:IPT/TIG domain-containing protein [Candidatus Scalindua japonica]|nr:IPT/TIG domain-containing protein [Candidatus Scalindua japonica]